jgi:hypothetical protein
MEKSKLILPNCDSARQTKRGQDRQDMQSAKQPESSGESTRGRDTELPGM